MSYYNYVLKIGTIFFDNSSISNTVWVVHLYKDGLHLNNYGKDELANDFIDNIYIVFYGKIYFRWVTFGQTACENKRSSYKSKSHK